MNDKRGWPYLKMPYKDKTKQNLYLQKWRRNNLSKYKEHNKLALKGET